ncbi:unnamed protein product [Cutaneotrichosporon oleaginosum]
MDHAALPSNRDHLGQQAGPGPPLTEENVLASLEAARAARRSAVETGRRASEIQEHEHAAFNPTTLAARAEAAVDLMVESFKARTAAMLAECGALSTELWALSGVIELILVQEVSEETKEALWAYLAPGGRM